MSNNTAETLIGAAVLAVAAGFLVYAGQATGIGRSGTDTYDIVANFNSAEGLNVGTEVRMAGIRIGTVSTMDLNPKTYMAETRLAIRDDIELPDDSEVIVASEGLLGGSFVEVMPGGSDLMMAAGDEVMLTQGSVSLLNLLIKFAAGSSDSETSQ